MRASGHTLRSAALGPLVARVGSLAVSAGGSVLYTKVLVGAIGVVDFGTTSLVVGAMWILPALVAGSRTTIVNVVSRLHSESPVSLSQTLLLRAARIQIMVAITCLAVGSIAAVMVCRIHASYSWGTLMLVTGISLAVMTATSPGVAVVQGMGYQAMLSLVPIPSTALSLTILLVFVRADVGVLAAAAQPVAGAVISAALFLWGIHHWGLPSNSLRTLARKPESAHLPVFLPATVLTVASTLFIMSDRYLIGVSGALLAGFIVAQQLAAPLIALTVSVGDGLWVYVERQKGDGRDGRVLRTRVIALSAGIGLALGLVVLVLTGWFVRFMLGEDVPGIEVTVVLMGALVAVHGVNNGVGALMKDAGGLRTMALIWSVAFALKVLLVLLTAALLGPNAAFGVGVIVLAGATAAAAVSSLRVPVDSIWASRQ